MLVGAVVGAGLLKAREPNRLGVALLAAPALAPALAVVVVGVACTGLEKPAAVDAGAGLEKSVRGAIAEAVDSVTAAVSDKSEIILLIYNIRQL